MFKKVIKKSTRKSMLIRPSGRSTDFIKEILIIFVYGWNLQNTVQNRQ